MQYYYDENNLLRALDEAEFWKHQEAEHTTVIILVTNNLEPKYFMELQEFGEDFSHMHSKVVNYIGKIILSKGNLEKELKSKIFELVTQCIEQSEIFVEFLEEMLQTSKAVKSSTSSQIVIHHIIRESQYFINIDQLMLYP